jgi:hypothetical protein
MDLIEFCMKKRMRTCCTFLVETMGVKVPADLVQAYEAICDMGSKQDTESQFQSNYVATEIES